MKKQFQRGFTLIELLVVIAIIGILAAVVLASLNDARSGGNDAAIKQTLSNIRSQAEIIYNANNFSYETVCENADIVTMGNRAAGNGVDADGVMVFTDPTAATFNGAVCHDSAQAWAVSVPLTDSTSGAISLWCVDSTGAAGKVTTARPAANAYICS